MFIWVQYFYRHAQKYKSPFLGMLFAMGVPILTPHVVLGNFQQAPRAACAPAAGDCPVHAKQGKLGLAQHTCTPEGAEDASWQFSDCIPV